MLISSIKQIKYSYQNKNKCRFSNNSCFNNL